MSPTVVAPPGAPIAPAPTTVNPQGVASVAPTAPAVPTALPQPQAPTPIPTAPTAPNLSAGTSQAIQQIGDYYNIPRQTTQIVNAAQASGTAAQQQFDLQKYQNNVKITNLQNSINPDSYSFSKNSDGSVSIVNSVGDKVSIGTYAALTGENPATALTQAGATDQASEKFIAAYNNLQTYTQDKIAAKGGDAQAQAEVQQYEAASPGLANLELGQLQTAFMNQYGSYFGQPQQGAGGGNLGPGITPTLSSLNNPQATSAYENPTYANLVGGSSTGGSSYTGSPVAGNAATSNTSLLAEIAQIQAQSGS